MLTIALLAGTHVVSAAAGAYAWPHAKALHGKWSASRALSNAKATIAAQEAQMQAYEAAKKLVAGATGTHA